MSEEDFKKMFSSRLRHYLEVNKMSQKELADRLGVGTTSVSNWCKGLKIPRMNKVDAICEIFHIGRTDLIKNRKEPTNNVIADSIRKKYAPALGIRIPVLGRIAAGIPIDAIEHVIDYEEVDGKLAALGDLFGLKIKGDSMTPRICDKDVVIVHQQPDAESGDIVVATINGDDAVCKRLIKYQNAIVLRSTNPAYEDIDVTGREDFRIIGKVVELRGKV